MVQRVKQGSKGSKVQNSTLVSHSHCWGVQGGDLMVMVCFPPSPSGLCGLASFSPLPPFPPPPLPPKPPHGLATLFRPDMRSRQEVRGQNWSWVLFWKGGEEKKKREDQSWICFRRIPLFLRHKTIPRAQDYSRGTRLFPGHKINSRGTR